MLRPERMSKVSVTGSKAVLTDVIETLHDLRLVHVTDYDGSWEGFAPGDPLDGAEDASDKLVTVRSIESILDLDPDDVGPVQDVDPAELGEELEEIRTQVIDLDDRRGEIESDLDDVLEELDRMESFVDLGIDLDLLSGYDTLQVQVGEADEDAVQAVLDDADRIEAYETWATEGVVAAFAYPADRDDETALEDALVGVEFATLEVPDGSGSPTNHVEQLIHRRQQLSSRLEGVENELEAVKLDAGSFILAAEEQLTIEVQKREVPLEFATTERSFVAEGWVPTERYPELESALAETVGDHVAVEELLRADYEEPHHTEHVSESGAATEGPGEGVAADGGVVHDDQPPVVQDNPGPTRPFELLVETINRPKYFEFDPTVLVFLTFPLFFGFMIGDTGYGILYMLIGWTLYDRFDSAAIRSLGGIALWAGGFTFLFGILYGEFFGLHIITEHLWTGVFEMEHAPIEKGLSPAAVEWAQAWLVVALVAGLAHVGIGYVLDFVENLEHGLKVAVLESGSWMLMLFGLWAFVFSQWFAGKKPEFLFTVFAGEPFALGFAGFPTWAGMLGIAAFVVGLVLLYLGEPLEVVEFLQPMVNILSYARIPAVLLAKAGMAFVVNLLFFGAYNHHGEFHFITGTTPGAVEAQYGAEVILFPGLIHGGVIAFLAGIVILVLGHLLVLALGITSAGLQAVRLEYVEFFSKFYDGGGEAYEPFGYEGRLAEN
jgi:V/A-type H+-transporting ATPase subunit I